MLGNYGAFPGRLLPRDPEHLFLSVALGEEGGLFHMTLPAGEDSLF